MLDADAFGELHADRVPDGGAPARGTQGRRHAAAPDHRPAGEAAGAGHHHRRPDPSAEQPGRGDRTRGGRPAGGRRQDAAQAGDAGRRQVHPGGAARPGQHAGRGRRTGRQVQVAGTHARWRPPTARTRSATGSRITASPAAWDYAPTFVEAGLDIDWLERISASVDEVDAIGVAAGRHRLAEVHHRHRAADEPDRRGEQADLGAARRRQAVLADGPRALSERRHPRAAAQHRR